MIVVVPLATKSPKIKDLYSKFPAGSVIIQGNSEGVHHLGKNSDFTRLPTENYMNSALSTVIGLPKTEAKGDGPNGRKQC